MARQVQTQIGRARARVPGFAVALAENPKEWGKWKEYRALTDPLTTGGVRCELRR